MPPKKVKGVRGSPSTRGGHNSPSEAAVSDTPRPELPTPLRPKRQDSKTNKVLESSSPKTSKVFESSPKTKQTKRRKSTTQVAAEDPSDLSEVLSSARGNAKGVSSWARSKQGGLVRRLWAQCSGAVLIAVFIVLFIILLKIGEDEYLDVTSSSTRATSNPYHALGLKQDATKKQIRKAYRALTLKFHPDRQEQGCDDQCRLKFNEIHQAYKLLIDDDRRSLYDAYQYDSMPDTKKAFMNKIEYWEFTGSVESVKSILKPSLNGAQLSLPPHVTGAWAYLVADTRHEVTDYILETWTEIASKLYGKVAFMRVEGSDEATRKALPLNPVMLPAIIYCDPMNRCQIYNQLMNYGPVTFPKWLLAQYPDTITEWQGSIDALAELVKQGKTAEGKTPIVVTGALKPPTIIRGLALKTSEAFEWIYTSSVEIVEMLNVQPFEMDRGTRGLVVSPNVNKSIIQLHGGLWQLDKEKWYRERSESEDVKTARHGHAYLSLIEAVHDVSRANEMPLTEETLLYLCQSNDPRQRIICRVRVDPPGPPTAEEIGRLQRTSLQVEPIALASDTRAEEVLAQIDDETDIDMEVEEPDEPSDLTSSEEKQETKTFIQAVRLDTHLLGSLRSDLVRLSTLKNKSSFYLDFAAGKYRMLDTEEWINLPAGCASKQSAFSGITCAPRSNLSLKERIKLFVLNPWGFTKAYYSRSRYHAFWLAPSLSVYAIVSCWILHSMWITMSDAWTISRNRSSIKDDLSEDANTD
eukprot:Gregarina_sp_Pseudo_9__1209@NODE_179_length_3809_cov_9_044828_g165_i0_p1_GENE_NODE_179_length_3809_cov_9_044828_g165_i0NODE_179_length_3809_cov_9_044828_g165_i0_p1_ORF_typecomplete_len750_score90_41DnaJ/PF00226_31/2_4e17Thioredoxin_6/PF13848_6/0_061_NODE_179_length_3809_cov_9_044828_g165_i011553404